MENTAIFSNKYKYNSKLFYNVKQGYILEGLINGKPVFIFLGKYMIDLFKDTYEISESLLSINLGLQ